MKHLLLLGAGHAHALVLKNLAAAPLKDVTVTVVSPHALAPYSGMVPGWLAGAYRWQDICINFAPLAQAAGARFVLGEVAALEAANGRVSLADGQTLQADVVSLNIGSTLHAPPGLPGQTLALRPLAQLGQAWPAVLANLQAPHAGPALKVAAVGGGAAGVECLLAALAALGRQRTRLAHGTLFSGSDRLLPGLAPRAAAAALAALTAAGVDVVLRTRADVARLQPFDLVLWAAGAQAHDWPAHSGLAVSEAGFVCVDADLRSNSHPQVFAAGDCAHWQPPLPKAGVYAVRMGPVLAHNLRAALCSSPLQRYVPQEKTLALLATGAGQAIATRGNWCLAGPLWGRAAWRWKDHIDRAFLAQFKRLDAPAAPADLVS